MPGAPNRPPEKTPETSGTPPPPESAEKVALRRLAPSRVALLLDPWKGALSADLLVPFTKAEAAYASADYAAATNALDQLSIRFAEPRWPTLPEPFRLLRVSIPAPMPPHWNPEHALTPLERAERQARRVAEEQLALATSSVAWAAAHQVEVSDLSRSVEEARALLSAEGASPGFYERIDSVWAGIRARVPLPKGTPTRPGAPSAAAAEVGEA